jgi:hypothetical protein
VSKDCEPVDARAAVGLCASCAHSRQIESERGSIFWLCRLSDTDPRFPKYPRLPVLSCPGYRKSNDEDREKTH